MIGIVMWVAMLKSGVHATLAGVILAMFIPMKSKTKADYSPLKSMEHDLHSAVAFMTPLQKGSATLLKMVRI
jgi:NhaA family Na+:H+ antiporter